MNYFWAIVLISAVISISEDFGSALPARAVTVNRTSSLKIVLQFHCATVKWHTIITINCNFEIFWILWVWSALVGLLCLRRGLWFVLETQVVFISDMYKSTSSREAVNRMTLVSFVVYVHSCTGILVSLINRELLMTIVIEYIPRVVPLVKNYCISILFGWILMFILSTEKVHRTFWIEHILELFYTLFYTA